jgi:capsular exopolysaccharide synthesis family protein
MANDGKIRPIKPGPLLETRGALVARQGFRVGPAVVVVAEPTKGPSEELRALRTDLVAQHLNEGRRALAVCAASPGVGCSFVAANLAVSLSQIGLSTLLIDADLRHPSMDQYISPPTGAVGLSECLRSPIDGFADYIEADVLPNLSIMYAGDATAGAQELLAGERFKQLMDYCLRDFDVTIVDTPAANGSADARLISSVVGYSLIVARRDKTFVADIKALAGQLESDRAKVIGSVLTEA